MASQDTIVGHAKSLLSDLSFLRKDKSRAIVFVGHSLGGLVIKQALINSSACASHSRSPNLAEIYQNTKGVVFLGTPHRGSDKASLANIVANVGTLVLRQPNKQLLESLQPSSGTLEYLRDGFTTISRNMSIVCVREEKPTAIGIIVPATSATLDGYNVEQISVPEDHQGMARYATRLKIGYKRICSVLQELVDDEGGISSSARETWRTGVLDSLYYPMIGDREAGIAEAYGNTFSWALEEEGFDRLVRMPFTEHGESSKSKVDSSFVSWLVSDSDHLFWLSGKAASGKSTLMKYLFNDKRTKKKLMKWAGASDPILAAFFFFERGDALQKSREGLLRSLLWQILSQRRDLISLVFDPIREDQNQPVPLPQITWPILKKAFTQLLDSIPKSTKICLFVDGLDEYRMMDREKDYGENEMHLLSYGTNDDFRDYPEGNWIRDGHQEIASLFQNTKAQNVKICVASRELTPFEAAFATTPRLRIHEFTKGDIHNYVYSRLMGEGREHFYDADDMKDIADTVVKYAEGVFLWVRLVVEELRKGQDDGDRIEDLYTKLMKLPKTLGGRNGLYMRMVDMSPARGEAIKLFQLTLYHGFPPDLDVLFFAADELYEADNSKKSIFLDPEPLAPSDEIHNDRFLRAVKQEVKFVTADRAQQKLNQLERRLKSRCMGLLEVPRSSRKVQFFHQTCKEFVYGLLQKTQTEEKLEDSQLVLRFLSAYVMKLKTHDFMGGRSTLELGPFEAAFGALARFARCIEPSHRPDISDGCFQLMDEVRQLCDTRDMSQDENIINYCFKTYMQKKRSSVRFFPWDFLSLSTINLLETYIQMTLERTGIDPDNGTKLLCEIIMEPHMGIEPTILKIINHLLSHGVDLHRRVGNSAFAMSAWETLLHRAVHLKKTGRDLGAIVAIMTTISNFKANINGQDQVRFLTHAGLEFSGIPWEGNLRQVLCGLLKLPESVVLALIGIPTVDWGDYLPELPGMGSWKVEVKRYQPTTT